MRERLAYNPTAGRMGSVFRSLDRSLDSQRGITDIRRTAESIQKQSNAPHAIAGVVERIREMHSDVAAESRLLTDAASYGIVARALHTFVGFGERGTPTVLDTVGLGPGGRNTRDGILGSSMYLVLKELPNAFQIASTDFLPPISKDALQNNFRFMLENRIPEFPGFIDAFIDGVVPASKRSAVLREAMTDAFVLGFLRAGNPDDDLSRGAGGSRPPLPPNPSDEQPSGVSSWRPRSPYGSSGVALPLPSGEEETDEQPERRVLVPSRR